ncbi:MAG: HAD family hydrolase, partial [Eubacteriales bacterium]
KMIKAVIFDLDGTLAYTFDDIRTAMDAMRAAYGLPPISTEELTRIVNFTTRDFATEGLEGKVKTEEEIKDAMKIYSAAYAECYLDTTRVYDGLPEALASLKEKGIKLAVYSNKMEKFVKAIMLKIYGEGVFDILKGPDGIKPKPDPMGALIIAKEWGLAPSEISFVGDSVLDMKTGNDAGMTSIGVLWGYTKRELLENAGADHIVDTVPELASLIEKLADEK